MELVLANSAAITSITSANNAINAANTFTESQPHQHTENTSSFPEALMIIGFFLALYILAILLVEGSINFIRK